MHHRKTKKMSLLVCTIVVLIALTATTVFAYLFKGASEVKNDFSPAFPTDPKIHETFNSVIKENVSVDVNNPGYAVYIRAAVVVTWVDASGNVHGIQPVAGTDYEIDFSLGAEGTENVWFNNHDGFYYYTSPVNSGNTTVLINSCKVLREAPDEGYTLNVQVISQTIQALGTTDTGDIPAVTDAWGVEVNDKGLLIKAMK